MASIYKAAEQGDANAQSKLAMMYHNGRGCAAGRRAGLFLGSPCRIGQD